MQSYDLLVIILSSALGFLLLLSIIAMIFFIKVLRRLKSITEKADHVAGNIESVSGFFKRTAGPIAVSGLIANILEAMKSDKKKKEK